MVKKRAWIRVIEAFLSAMLIIVILVLIAVNQQNSQPQDKSEAVYNSEISVIRTIELNNTLRGEVMKASVPIDSDNVGFPPGITNVIGSKASSSLSCDAKICETNSTCDYWKPSSSEIYAKDTFITSNLTDYAPRKLKIFCIEK